MSRDTTSTLDPVTRGHIMCEEKAERVRRRNRMQQFQREEMEMEAARQAEEAAVKKQREQQREQALAEALGRQKQEQLRAAKEVQKIREEAPELRDLRSKLAAAQVNQQREAQLYQARAKAEDDKVKEYLVHQEMEAARQATIRAEEEKEMKRRTNALQQRGMIEQQMEQRDVAKVEAYKEYLRERQIVDDIVKKIHEDDAREAADRSAKQQQLKEYIQQYLTEREDIKKRERELQDDEDRRIVEFMKARNQRQEDQRHKLQVKHREHQRILEQQSAAIAEERRKKEEMEDVLIEYYKELREEKERQAEQESLIKKTKDREQMIEANEYQKRIRAARAEADRKEEEEYRRVLMDKFAEDDRIEQMNAVKRNQRRAEHSREVQRLIEEKRIMREAERQRELEELRLQKEQEKRKQDIIEAERRRLLEEHAVALSQYLPKGVLRKDEIERLGIDPTLTSTHVSVPSFVRAHAPR